MRLLPHDDDYACFIDADAMFLTPDFGHQLTEIVNRYPDAGMFTALTNRVGNRRQCYKFKLSKDSNIVNHRYIADLEKKRSPFKVSVVDYPISGHLMMIQKKVWKHFPFAENLKILGVDNEISSRMLKAGYKIYLMKGVYIFHYYRLKEGGQIYKKHLL